MAAKEFIAVTRAFDMHTVQATKVRVCSTAPDQYSPSIV